MCVRVCMYIVYIYMYSSSLATRARTVWATRFLLILSYIYICCWLPREFLCLFFSSASGKMSCIYRRVWDRVSSAWDRGGACGEARPAPARAVFIYIYRPLCIFDELRDSRWFFFFYLLVVYMRWAGSGERDFWKYFLNYGWIKISMRKENRLFCLIFLKIFWTVCSGIRKIRSTSYRFGLPRRSYLTDKSFMLAQLCITTVLSPTSGESPRDKSNEIKRHYQVYVYLMCVFDNSENSFFFRCARP